MKWIPICILISVSLAAEEATILQQKAISELVQALSHVKKVLSSGSGSSGASAPKSPNQSQSPFRDRKKFKLPEMKPENNPANQAAALAAEQKKLAAEIRKHPEADHAPSKQKQQTLKQAAQKLAGNLKNAAAGKISDAAKNMEEAERQLEGNKPAGAALRGEQAAAKLEHARRTLARDSDRRSREALERTARKLDELDRKLKASPDRRDAVAEQLAEIPAELAQAAEREQQQGTFENARTLGKVAERIHDGATTKADRTQSVAVRARRLGETIAALKKVTAAAKLGNRDPGEYLASFVEELNQGEKALRYAQRQNLKGVPDELRETAAEMQMILEDALVFLEKLKEELPEPADSAAFAAARKSLRKSLNALARPEHAETPSRLSDTAVAFGDLLALLRRRPQVRVFNEAEIPERHRAAAARYFERLSELEVEKE